MNENYPINEEKKLEQNDLENKENSNSRSFKNCWYFYLPVLQLVLLLVGSYLWILAVFNFVRAKTDLGNQIIFLVFASTSILSLICLIYLFKSNFRRKNTILFVASLIVPLFVLFIVFHLGLLL